MPKLNVPLAYPFAAPAQHKNDLERLANEVYRFGQAADQLYDVKPRISALILRDAVLQFGSLNIVNPQGRALTLTLPQADKARDAGSRIEIQLVTEGTVRVQTIGSHAIDSQSQITLTAIGLYIIRFDGTHYYSTHRAIASTPAYKELRWRANVHTMAPTFVRHLEVMGEATVLPPTSRNRATLIEPGFPGTLTELQVYRYGHTGGPIPSAGLSGVATNAGQWVFTVEKNGNPVATYGINTGVAHQVYSLGLTHAYSDQIGIRVSTPTGKTWGYTLPSQVHTILKSRV